MRSKLIISAMLIMVSVTLSGQFTKIGMGLIYSTGPYFNGEKATDHKPRYPAFNFKGIYEISLPLHISPSFSIYIPRVTPSGTSKHVITAYMIDLNAHYVFNSLDKIEFYGLGGVDIMFMGSKWVQDSFTDKSSETSIGLNLGAGTYYKLTESLDLFGEARYTLSTHSQFVFTAGVLLNLQYLNKKGKDGL